MFIGAAKIKKPLPEHVPELERNAAHVKGPDLKLSKPLIIFVYVNGKPC